MDDVLYFQEVTEARSSQPQGGEEECASRRFDALQAASGSIRRSQNTGLHIANPIFHLYSIATQQGRQGKEKRSQQPIAQCASSSSSASRRGAASSSAAAALPVPLRSTDDRASPICKPLPRFRVNASTTMQGATTLHGFKRSLESAGQRQQQQHGGGGGGGVRPTGERRRIAFVKPRNPKNGFISLSTLMAGGAGGGQHQQQHGKVRGGCDDKWEDRSIEEIQPSQSRVGWTGRRALAHENGWLIFAFVIHGTEQGTAAAAPPR